MSTSRYQKQLAMMQRIHPRLPRPQLLERAFVDVWLQGATGNDLQRVLDAGCGFQNGLVVHYPGRLWSVGIDADFHVVQQNRDLDAKAVASCGGIPLRSASVDLIFHRDVLEHLQDPKAAMGEFFRVLKPGGAVVISTVNVKNPAMWSVRFVPMWFRAAVRSASFGPELGENAPTFYRANTRAQIVSLLEREGFQILQCDYYPTFVWYFRFATPLLLLFTYMNRLLDIVGLTRFYGGILVVASKPAASDRR